MIIFIWIMERIFIIKIFFKMEFGMIINWNNFLVKYWGIFLL